MKPGQKSYSLWEGGGAINCQEKITRESETTESKQKMNSCGPEKKARKLHQRTDKLNRIPSRT